jgi:hypothetical protein
MPADVPAVGLDEVELKIGKRKGILPKTSGSR